MKRASLAVFALLMLAATPTLRAEAATDTTPPKLWVPQFAPFQVGRTIGPSAEATPTSTDEVYTWSIDERAKWYGRDASGICGYDVDVVWAGAAPTPLLTGTMRRSVRTDLATDYDGTFGGGSFVPTGLRVTAYDCAGNSTTKDIAIQALVSQEDGTFQRPFRPQEVTFTHKGKWKTSNYSGFSGGHTRKTYSKGASVEIDVVTDVRGEHVALVMEKGPNRGKANVYVDGKFKNTINTYAKNYKHRVIVFDAWLDAGPHTIKVVNKATPGHPRIDIDAVLTHDTYVTSGAGRLTVTYDEDHFLAANRIRVTQTFDHPTEFPPEKRTVSFQGVRFWSKDTAAPYWRVGGVEGANVQCPEVCRLYRAFSDGPDETADMAITFRRHGTVRSFGFLLDVFGFPNQFMIRVVESDGRVTPIWLAPDAGDTYVGLHSRIGIKNVVIQQPNQVEGFGNFAIDQFSRSYIMT